jgi:putative glutamine amidotransferase
MSKESVRIGVPFRSLEDEQGGAAKSHRIDFYYQALRRAGAEPVAISLQLSPKRLHELCLTLDGFVLPGSGNDVDPARYGEKPHPKTAATDIARETTDFTLLDHVLVAGKPVLAICYGNQLLNVYRGGSLVQDIPSEPGRHVAHTAEKGSDYPEHDVTLTADSLLHPLAGSAQAHVNSSHHQAIRKPGRDLRVTAHAPDGIIEAVEWTGDSHWIVGVQWHPERMERDSFAATLFRQLVAAAHHMPVRH